jgi:hypothetical protein
MMPVKMKTATFIFVLVFCSAATGAQTDTTPPADVRIRISTAGSPEYCRGSTLPSPQIYVPGAQGPNDIKLRLRLKLWYVNYRTETIVLPPQSRMFTRMTVSGQNEPTILRNSTLSGVDVKTVLASSTARPASTFTLYDFSILSGRPAAGTAPELLQCLSAKDPGCISDLIVIPILDRSSGIDLREKTIQIMTTRGHSLPPDAVQKLNEKWKQYGTVWSGAVDSEPLTLQIYDEPSPRDCKP